MPNWNENKPTSSDLLSALPSTLTSQAITFRGGIEKHSFWTDSSGVSAGIPRLSSGSTGPGAARAFYDVESNLSSALSASKPLAGRLYVASDASRFWGYSSGDTIPLGGTRAIVYKTPTVKNNARVLVQMGSATLSGSLATVVFTTTYSSPAAVQLTPTADVVGNITLASVVTSGTTNFSAIIRTPWGGASPTRTVLWRSHGTVTL